MKLLLGEILKNQKNKRGTYLDYKKLGKFLKAKRTKLKMTQAEVASILKCHGQFISNIERGVCRPPLNGLKTLLNIYKINQKEFIKYILDEEREFLEKVLSNTKRYR